MFHLRGFLFCAFFHLVTRRELPCNDVKPTSVLSSNGVLSVYGSNSQFYLCKFTVGETTSVCFIVEAGGFALTDVYSSSMWRLYSFNEAFRNTVCQGCTLDFTNGVAWVDCNTLALSTMEVTASELEPKIQISQASGNLNSAPDNKVQPLVIHILHTNPTIAIALILSTSALLIPLARLLTPIYQKLEIQKKQLTSPSEKQNPLAENPGGKQNEDERSQSAPCEELDSRNLVKDGAGNKEKKRRRRKKKGSSKNENLSSPAESECVKKSSNLIPDFLDQNETASLHSAMFSLATTLPYIVPTPIIAPHARAPGAKLHDIEVKTGGVDEDFFAYDMWGDHLFGLPSKTDEWESFFLSDPEIFTHH